MDRKWMSANRLSVEYKNEVNLFLTNLPKPPEIPNNIEIVQPKVSNYDFNYFENLYLNFTNILYINCLTFHLNISNWLLTSYKLI